MPILALDMYEHAYHIDFGANVKAYVDTFFRNIDWPALELRHADALTAPAPRPLVQPEFGGLPAVSVEEVKAMMASGPKVQVIDTRPRHFISRQQDIAEGISWRDPEQLDQWIGELSKSEPMVVYCAHGFHVGCKTAIKPARSRVRRQVHEQRPLGLEGERRPGENADLARASLSYAAFRSIGLTAILSPVAFRIAPWSPSSMTASR